MADTVATLRPNGVNFITSFAVAGAADAASALNDNSDASWVNGSGGSVIVDMGTVSIPALAQIKSVTPRTRAKPGGILVNTHFQVWLSGVGGTDNVITPVDNTNIYNYTGGTLAVRPTDSAAWTQADIDALQWRCSGSGMSYYEAYLDVAYNQISVTSAVGVPTQVREDVTVTWTYSDPEGDAQTNRQIKLFTSAVVTGGGFDASSSTNAFDSGTSAGASTSYTANANLSPGHYYAYVRTTDAGTGNWSAWAASAEFRVVNSPLMIL